MLDHALQHHRAGRLQEAEALYRQILHAEPRHPNALHLLGLIAHQVGQHGAAVDLISQAIAVSPAAAEFHNDLGEACRALGRFEDAKASYHRALALKAGLVAAQYNLGLLHSHQGQLEEAAACYRRALATDPANAAAHNNLGNVLKAQGRMDEAVEHYRQALALKPDFAEAHNNQGTVFQHQGRLGKAGESYRRALALNPDYAEARNNLGNVLVAEGKMEEATACYRQALAVKPDLHVAHSNIVFRMIYDVSSSPEAIAAELRSWNDRYGRPFAGRIKAHQHNRSPERRLRVGYFTADFWGLSARYSIVPLLSAHDRARVEVFLYTNEVCSETQMARLRELSDVWHNIIGLADDAVAERIVADGIDVLIDNAGHGVGNRLLVFARKPAPIQVAYLNSITTTGLPTMDYRLTDGYLSPSGGPEWNSEEVVRLPGCFMCYEPLQEAPAVAPLPASANRYVTFGCFNDLVKVAPAIIALWSQILRLLPEARLILKDRSLADEGQCSRILGLFAGNGVPAERIELLPRTPMAEYLATYGRVDIALDTVPFNGCTTTCEALWMGVPVVSLAGVMTYGRFGVSLLSTLGLHRLIATTEEEYVRIAVELASSREELSKLRAELRPRMAASPLCDAKSFARGVERAYRMMWDIYVKGEAPRPFAVSP